MAIRLSYDVSHKGHRIWCFVDCDTGDITYRDVDSPKAVAKTMHISKIQEDNFTHTMLEDKVLSCGITTMENNGIDWQSKFLRVASKNPKQRWSQKHPKQMWTCVALPNLAYDDVFNVGEFRAIVHIMAMAGADGMYFYKGHERGQLWFTFKELFKLLEQYNNDVNIEIVEIKNSGWQFVPTTKKLTYTFSSFTKGYMDTIYKERK